MNLEKAKQIEMEMRVLEMRLGPCLNQEARFALQDACVIIAEVRHFVMCWEEVETDLKEGRDPERCRDNRDEAITRLVNAFRPLICETRAHVGLIFRSEP